MRLFIPRHRLRAILNLGLPVIGGMLSQSLLNLADTAMVGVLGMNALAGVGVGGYAAFMATALILGLSSAVQAMVARRSGEGRNGDLALPVTGGVLLALIACIPLSLVLFCSSASILPLISSDPGVLEVAVPYFDYRVAGILAVGLSLSFRGYWNGLNRGWVYLRLLILMHLLNVIISFGLIFGVGGLPEMGAAGAGLGTTLALLLGALITGVATFRDILRNRPPRLLPDRHTLRSLLRLSVPSSVQQFLFATSVTVLFWIIGQIGAEELAVAQVLINLALLLILPAVGLGMAATTLVSQALGNQEPDRAEQIGWDVVRLTTLVLIVLSLPMWFTPKALLSLFIHDDMLMELATAPLQITGVAICIDAAAIVFAQALLGAGANRTVMMVTTLGQWAFYLPLAWLVGPVAGQGLVGIWLIQLLHRGASSAVFSAIWARRNWTRIRL